MPRSKITPAITSFSIYVPKGPALDHVAKTSAIVGHAHLGDDLIRCAFEGGIYQDMPFDERLIIACWRLAAPSPSVAYAAVRSTDVTEIGTAAWDSALQTWVVSEIHDTAAAEDWFGELPEIGGSAMQRKRGAAFILDEGRNLAAVAAYQAACKNGEDGYEAIISHARRDE